MSLSMTVKYGNKNNSTKRDCDICVRNNGHYIHTSHDTVLTQHVISNSDRIELGEKYTTFIAEGEFVYAHAVL